MVFTFLMTDIEGSALLWDEDAPSMSAALAQHDQLVEQTVATFRGRLIKSKGEGDATLSVFDDPGDAACAAVALQKRLREHPWPTSRRIAVRIALDTGEAEGRGDDFFGPVLNRCARLRGAGHGEQILLSSAAAKELTASAFSQASVIELGAFRLKGLKQVERVYQLTAEGFPNAFGPLRALDVRLHNLPEETISSVGREEELAEALAALRTNRLVTIWGPGGVGKTHLALRVAAQLVEKVADGVWWVDLVGINDPQLIAEHVAHVLGLADPMTTHTIDDLCDALRPRDLVLVLDNCEHLLGSLSELASRLLANCADVRLLATSRERFGVPGEALLSLGGLELPPQVAQPSDARAAPAIRLFLDRAGDIGVTLDESQTTDLELVKRVCTRLEGLPLAIELAAAALATMSLSDLVEEIGERLDVLDASPSRAPGGRRTMRGTIEWSFSRAAEEEQRALVACSVFAGSFTLQAARTIAQCRTSLLLRLVEQSLITRDTVANRYRLLAPIREFAAEVPELEDALYAARTHFLTWLIAQTEPPDPVSQGWLDALEAEIDNLRGGLTLASREDARALCEIAVNLTSYWHVRGPLSEGRAWLETGLAQCDSSWLDLLAPMKWAHGFITSFLGDYQAAARSFEEALLLARQIGATALEARILGGLGALAQALGELDTAQERLEESVARAREANEIRSEAASLGDLGVLAAIQGNLETARDRYQAGLELQERIGDLQGASVSMYNLGEVAEALGETASAARLWRKSFENYSVTLKDRYRAAATLRSFALVHSEQDPERAAVALGAAEAVIQLVGPHEPTWLVPPRLARRRDECLTRLGPEHYEQLQLKGAGMSLEEAAQYIGLVE